MQQIEFLIQPAEFLMQPTEFLIQQTEFLMQQTEFLIQQKEFLMQQTEPALHSLRTASSTVGIPEPRAQRPFLVFHCARIVLEYHSKTIY